MSCLEEMENENRLSGDDLSRMTCESSEVWEIPYFMDSDRKEVEKILG